MNLNTKKHSTIIINKFLEKGTTICNIKEMMGCEEIRIKLSKPNILKSQHPGRKEINPNRLFLFPPTINTPHSYSPVCQNHRSNPPLLTFQTPNPVQMSAQKSSGPVIRSNSSYPRFNSNQFSTRSPPPHSSSSFASATTSAFNSSSRSFRRHASPTRVNLYNYNTPSISFSLDRSGSESRTVSFSSRSEKPPTGAAPPRRSCMCSPTNHPGSFRCSLHKAAAAGASNSSQAASCGSSSRLILRRSAMKNSLVRIGTVEGDLVRRALAALIRPSSHHQRRRGEFRRRPSRLSAMSTA